MFFTHISRQIETVVRYAVTLYLIALVYGIFDYLKEFEFAISAIATTSRIGIIFLFFGCIRAVQKKEVGNLLVGNRYQALVFSLFIIFTAVCLISTFNAGLLSKYSITVLQPLMIFAVVLLTVRTRKHLNEILFVFYAFTALVSIIYVASVLNPGIAESIIFVELTSHLDRIANVSRQRAMIFGLNENTIAYILDLAIALNVYYLFKKPFTLFNKILPITALLSLLTALFIAASIGAVITLTIAVMVVLFLIGKIKAGWLYAIITIFMIYIIVPEIYEPLINKSLYRVTNEDASIKLRTITLAYSWNIFLEYPWLGIGDLKGTTPPFINTSNHVHYVQLLAVYGVFAFSTLLMLIYKTATKLLYLHKKITKKIKVSANESVIFLAFITVLVCKACFAPLFLEIWVILALSHVFINLHMQTQNR